MYDRVLVPTDGSDTAENAVQCAVDLARRHDAEVHTLYVVDVGNPPESVESEDLWDPVIDAVRNQGNQQTREVLEMVNEAGLDGSQAVLEGDRPADTILDYVDDHDIDVIVMGTHGRSGPARWLMGSVSERVIRSSSIPVLVVPYDGD